MTLHTKKCSNPDCPHQQEYLPLELFYYNSGVYSPKCKECTRVYNRAMRVRNKDKITVGELERRKSVEERASKLMGVYPDVENKERPFLAKIKLKGKLKLISNHSTPLKAHQAYKDKYYAVHGRYPSSKVKEKPKKHIDPEVIREREENMTEKERRAIERKMMEKYEQKKEEVKQDYQDVMYSMVVK